MARSPVGCKSGPVTLKLPTDGLRNRQHSWASREVYAPKAFRQLDASQTQPPPLAWTSRMEQPSRLSFPHSEASRRCWEAERIWYTDGSARDGESGKVIGAGVYCQAAGIALPVGCCGVGPTNTITRAELCALYESLQRMGLDSDETIATDSQAIMQLIAKDLRVPDTSAESMHRVLVKATTHLLLERAANGLKTRIIKVKSHTGITCNDKADELAHQAAVNPPEDFVNIGSAFDGLYWPGVVPVPSTSGDRDLLSVANLNRALKDAARPHFQTGLTNHTMYVQMWQDSYEHMDLKISNGFWTSSAILQHSGNSASPKSTLGCHVKYATSTPI